MKRKITLILFFPIWISSNTTAHTTDISELVRSTQSKYDEIVLEDNKYVNERNGKIDNKNELIEALIWDESSDNDSAYHNDENAIGCLQIRPIMVKEVNRVGKLKGMIDTFEHKDAWNRNISIAMFDQWSSVHYDDDDFELMARSWNGGPNGINKTATEKYWKKVLNYASKHL